MNAKISQLDPVQQLVVRYAFENVIDLSAFKFAQLLDHRPIFANKSDYDAATRLFQIPDETSRTAMKSCHQHQILISPITSTFSLYKCHFSRPLLQDPSHQSHQEYQSSNISQMMKLTTIPALPLHYCVTGMTMHLE